MSQTSLPRRTSPWAIILIAIGVIWLLAEANIFNRENLSVLFRFWPLILIAFGLELLIGRNNQRMSLLIVTATVIVMLGLMLIGPSLGLAQTADIKTATYSAPLEGAESAEINLNANIAEVRLTPLSGGDELFTADVEYVGELTFDSGVDGSRGEITLDNSGSVSFNNIFIFDWFGSDSLNDVQWNIGINPNVLLDLNVTTGTGAADLDLSEFQINGLHINTGTGSVDVVLPSMDNAYDVRVETGTGGGSIRVLDGTAVNMNLSSGTGSMTIDVPDNAAVRVEASVGTGSVNVPGGYTRLSGDDGFIGDNGTWESEGFDSAERQILIEYDGGTGSLTVR